MSTFAEKAQWLEARLGLRLPEGAAGAVSRKVSGSERLWLAFDQIATPFIIQTVVECDLDGALELSRLRAALGALTEAQPGSKMRLTGGLRELRWVADAAPPRLRVVQAPDWDGQSPNGGAFLTEPLDPFHGPVAEVVVVEGSPLRLVFRVHHGVMDGAASLLFAAEFFTALRGEEPQPALADGPIDSDVGLRFRAEKLQRIKYRSPSLTGPADGLLWGTEWRRLRIPRRLPRAVSEIAIALSQASEVDRSEVAFLITVDMRRIARTKPCTANLAGLLRVGVAEALQSDDPVARFDEALLKQLVQRKFGTGPVGASLLRYFPSQTLAWSIGRGLRSFQKRFPASAMLSHLGQLDLERLSGGGLRAKSVFSIPPTPPFAPLFVSFIELPEAVELCFLTPKTFATNGRLDALVDGVRRRLSA